MRTMMLSLLVALLAATAIVCPAPCWGQSIQDGSEAIVDKGITYEIPKAYELMHIAIALTDTSIVSNGYNLYHEVTDTSTQYYKAVMRYFGPYRNHPLIEALNASLKKSASNYLYNLQMAYNSALVNGQVVEQDRLSPALRIVYSRNSVPRKQLDSFARATQFDMFYQQQRAYYAQGLAKAKEKADVDNQQRWLERYFSARYAQYNIVLSPLMYGTHFTQRFVQHEKPTCVMWVSLPSHDTGSGTRLHTARYIGTVMTEIDHNYINPASDRYTKLINRVMGDSNRKNWVTATYSSNSYQTGYKVFNEYMTHAAYLLYTAERLGAADQAVLESGKIQSMERRRGFHRFGAFYRALRQLFAPVQATQTIESLYPAILDWCQKQNEE